MGNKKPMTKEEIQAYYDNMYYGHRPDDAKQYVNSLLNTYKDSKKSSKLLEEENKMINDLISTGEFGSERDASVREEPMTQVKDQISKDRYDLHGGYAGMFDRTIKGENTPSYKYTNQGNFITPEDYDAAKTSPFNYGKTDVDRKAAFRHIKNLLNSKYNK